MITPNPLLGTGLHAIGGGAAACCYLPYEKIKTWSYESFWMVQALFAWLIVPIVAGFLTVPDLIEVYKEADTYTIVVPILLGALYGFGGMAFGFAIRHIGYSLTYTISIGISAIIGTLTPLMMTGTVMEQYTRPGGKIFFLGMFISFIGLILCSLAGYGKEKDMAKKGDGQGFNMSKGVGLTVFAGILSGIIWFTVVSIKKKTIHELLPSSRQKGSTYTKNFALSAFAGSLWYMQFLFLGMANVRMGEFEFAGWGIHMFMLIFFSFVVGLIMKEWKGVNKRSFNTLLLALFVLLISFIVMTYASMIGENLV